MSIFLLYFDDGPRNELDELDELDELGRPHSQLRLSHANTLVRQRGRTLTDRVTLLTDGIASDAIRLGSDPRSASLRREVALLAVSRFLKGHAPKLLFHIFRGAFDDEVIDVATTVEISLLDVFVRVTRMQEPESGHSGAQQQGDVLELDASQSTRITGVGEGVRGPLGAVLQRVPYDALLAFEGGPRASNQVQTGPKKKGRRR